MNPAELGESLLCEELEAVIRNAGSIAQEIRSRGLTQHEKTGADNIVTDADYAVTAYLKAQLSLMFPGIIFSDEETEDTEPIDYYQHDLVAIIDPIDGTKCFAKGEKDWGISVGLVRRGMLQTGVIFLPDSNDYFSAERRKGAYLNGTQIHVDREKRLGKARITANTPRLSVDPEDHHAFQLLRDILLYDFSKYVRILGSQVVEITNIAAGRGTDIAFMLKTDNWDIAAGFVILSEAGGKCYSLEGEELGPSVDSILHHEIIFTNGTDIAFLVDLIKQARQRHSAQGQ